MVYFCVFLCVLVKYYIDKSGRDSLPDILANSYLDSAISTCCRAVRNWKGCDRMMCLFCVCGVFDREVGGYVVNVCQLFYLGHIVNFSSIVGHIKFEDDLSNEEGNQLINFRKKVYTSFQSNNGISCLFFNRTYDLDIIYRAVKKARYLDYSNAINCMLKSVELGKYYKSKYGVFEIVSDRGGRLETLHW